MYKTMALAIAALLAFAPPALAQASPAPPASDTTPPESRIAAAVDLLKANHTIDNMNAVLDALTPQMKMQLKRQAPSLSDETATTLIQKIRDVVMARQGELLRLYGIEYAQHFSEQELHDLADFYRSDLGRKYLSEIPVLVKETTPVMTRWMLGVITQEQQRILNSLPKPDKKT